MDCSTPSLPVYHQLPEITQTLIHWDGDAIQPSHPLLLLLAVQGILMSLLQHHSSKASIHRCSAFFMVPLSHPYTITGKTIALTIDRKQRILSTELKQATSVQESTHSVVLRSLCYLDTLRNGKRFEWLEGNGWKRNYFWRFKRYSWLSQCP